MKNVAILLTGIPRLAYCTEEVKHIAKNHKVFLFIWYWNPVDSVELSRNSWSGQCHGSSAASDVNLNFHPNIFKFPGVEIFSEIGYWGEMEPIFLEKRKEVQHFYNRKDVGVYSMWYAVMKANEMREKYEKDNNMIFDCVFRARFELKLMRLLSHPAAQQSDFNIEDFDMNVLWRSHTNCDIKYGMNDCLAFSSSKNMSHYCRIYDHINKYHFLEYESIKAGEPVTSYSEAIAFHHNNGHYPMSPQYVFIGK